MNILYAIIITLCVWLDGVLEADFVIRFHSSTWRENKRFLIYIPLACLIPEIFGAKNSFSILQTFLLVGLLFLFCLPFPSSFMRRALACVLFFATLATVNSSIITLYSSWRGISMEVLSKGTNLDRMITVMISKIFIFALCRIILKLTKGPQISRNKDLILLVVVPLLHAAILSFIGKLGLLFPMEASSTWMLSLLSLGVFVANLFQYYYFSQITQKMKLEMDNDLLQRQLECEREHIYEVQDAYNSVRQVKHDIKNTLLGIQHCIVSGNTEQGLEMIERVIGQMDLTHQYLQTSSMLLNYVINSKCNVAVKRNISVDVHVDSNGVETLDENELCILLGNLLDNAIEASVKEPERREIRLSIYEKKGYLILQVKNRISSSVLKNNPGLISKKKNAFEHGLGLPKIDRIVKEHDGNMDIFEKDGMFVVLISFPLQGILPGAVPAGLVQCGTHSR